MLLSLTFTVFCLLPCSDLPSDVSYYTVDLYNRNKRSKDVLIGRKIVTFSFCHIAPTFHRHIVNIFNGVFQACSQLSRVLLFMSGLLLSAVKFVEEKMK